MYVKLVLFFGSFRVVLFSRSSSIFCLLSSSSCRLSSSRCCSNCSFWLSSSSLNTCFNSSKFNAMLHLFNYFISFTKFPNSSNSGKSLISAIAVSKATSPTLKSPKEYNCVVGVSLFLSSKKFT